MQSWGEEKRNARCFGGLADADGRWRFTVDVCGPLGGEGLHPPRYPSMGVRGSGQATRQQTMCSDGATFAKKLGSAMCQGARALYRASVGEPALSTANKHCAGGCWPHHPWLSTSTVRERIRIPPCSADREAKHLISQPTHSQPTGTHSRLQSPFFVASCHPREYLLRQHQRPYPEAMDGCAGDKASASPPPGLSGLSSLSSKTSTIHGDKTRAGLRDPALWRGPLCFIVASITQHPSG